jgi:hypothetical protein
MLAVVRRLLKGLGLLVLAFLGIAAFPLLLPNCGRNRGVAAGKERVPDGEAEAIRTVVAGIERIQKAVTTRPALRDAHARELGCVRGSFTVQDRLPAELAVGLFAQARSYPAWIRFSSSNRKPQSDTLKDGRGMAIKVIGVPGDKILDEEKTATTHDFVMINHPVFFVRDAVDYVDFVAAEERGDKLGFFLGARPPWRWRLHEMLTGTRIVGHPIESPLALRYFSMTAYQLGERAIKFSARPCDGAVATVTATGDHALSETLAQQIGGKPACYDFQVQLQGDPHEMPVEDPTIEWAEKSSPFRTVAKIEIPAQPIETDQCEHRSYTPWHALPMHRPLGGINRVRRAAYTAISKLRHSLNGVERTEP